RRSTANCGRSSTSSSPVRRCCREASRKQQFAGEQMSKTAVYQSSLFPNLTARFPSTRYQGSKAKLADWIWEQIAELDFATCLDAFGGTGALAYRLKQAGKQVTYNDLLRFNYYFGLALIENKKTRLSSETIEWLLQKHPHITYPSFVHDNFHDIYFTDEENAWIDRTITNIRQLSDPYQFAIAFFALCQACIIKRPYNLFHRKNLYIRLAEVERSFGNKTTWDKPFEEWFRFFALEANQAVFDNGQENRALNLDAMDIPDAYDLVYIDTPYISKRGVAVDYFGFYHFLEGLTMYDEWRKHIDNRSKHRRLKPQPSEWIDRKRIHAAFERLFQRYQNSILVVSYRSDGIPSEEDLIALLRQFKRRVHVEYFGQYKYVLSTNSESKEMILIGT
ncbi:MAG: DNA adenine methylase, partial [Nitrospiria bacterium]